MTIAPKSFPKRLSLYIVMATSVLFIVAIGVAAVSSHLLIAEEAVKSSTNMLQAQINSIEKTLKGVESVLSSNAWIVKENIDNDDFLWDITKRVVEENDYIVGSTVAFKPYYKEDTYSFSPYSYIEDGVVYQKQLGSVGYDYFYLDWYQIPALLKQPVWSEPYFDEGGAQVLMSTYSYPILDDEGEIFAIFTADISTDWLSEMVSEIKPYESAYMTVVSRSGSFVATPNYDTLKNETIFSTSMRAKDPRVLEIADAMVNGRSGVTKYANSLRDMSFAVYGPLSNGWSASIICKYKDVLARTSQMHMILILVGLVGILVLFIICYLTIRRLTKPLSEFSVSAMSIAQGNFNTALPEINSQDEIKALRDSFDYLQKSLNEYIENLKATTSANERYASELNIASSIQSSMLPSVFPQNDRFDLYALVNPAKEVGGDLYDFYVKDDYLYFAVGDVSGKGVPASLYMAITRSAFRFISGQGLTIAQAISKINDSIQEGNEMGMFVTMFAAKVNLKTGHMEYCNAGHNPIVLNGRFLDVKPNIAVGLFPGFPYVGQECQLEPGSTLVLYTDGVSEAETASKDQFGDQRLLDWCAEVDPSLSAKDSCDSLLDSVRRFTAGNDQNDDITIMTIKFK